MWLGRGSQLTAVVSPGAESAPSQRGPHAVTVSTASFLHPHLLPLPSQRTMVQPFSVPLTQYRYSCNLRAFFLADLLV